MATGSLSISEGTAKRLTVLDYDNDGVMDFAAWGPDGVVMYHGLPGGRYGIECLNNLEDLPVKGATIIVGAPKHKGGTGGPARVLALV